MFSCGLAVSLFQDAVESLISTVAKEVGATIPQKIAFDAYWDVIKNAPNANGRTLPPNGKMLQLNTARVSFKHHGNVPSPQTAASLQIFAEEFLIETTQRFFGLDFSRLSMVALLSDRPVAEHLEKAEAAVEADDARLALEECAKGFQLASKPMAFLVPRLGGELSRAVRNVQPNGQVLQAVLRGVEQSQDALRNLSVMTSLGLPLVDFTRFRAVIPAVLEMQSGRMQIQWSQLPRSIEDARFAVRFLTDYAVAVEKAMAAIPQAARSYLW
jgi:hypothetical protein